MTYKNADKLKAGCILVHRNGGRTRCTFVSENFIWCEGGLEFYRETGEIGRFEESPFDIVDIEVAPEPIVGWVNVYEDGWGFVHKTKEHATLNCNDCSIALLELNFYPETKEVTVEVVE